MPFYPPAPTLGGFTDWEQEDSGQAGFIEVTQTSDCAVIAADVWYRIDVAGTYPILNLLATLDLNDDGTPTGDVVIDFRPALADFFPDFVVPDFYSGGGGGQLTINNAGPFALAYIGTGQLQPFTTAGVNVGGGVTLANGDRLLVSLLIPCRDSD